MDGTQFGTQQGYQGVAGVNPAAFAPQGFFGNVSGNPLAGVIGSGVGGLFGPQSIARQFTQPVGGDGIGGTFAPFNADPVTATILQTQLARQAQLAQLVQQAQLAQQVQLAQLAQQGQFAPQGQWGLQNPLLQSLVPQSLLSQNLVPQGLTPQSFVPQSLVPQGWQQGQIGPFGLGPQAGVFGQLGRLSPFNVDPITAAYAQTHLAQQAQMGQLVPQGLFGNVLGPIGQPIGPIGGPLGNPMFGGQIGGIGQLGRTYGLDPVTAACLQQAQQAQLMGAHHGHHARGLGLQPGLLGLTGVPWQGIPGY